MFGAPPCTPRQVGSEKGSIALEEKIAARGCLVLTLRIMNHKDVRTSIHLEAGPAGLRHFCRLVQTHANAKRMHEQSNQHKKAVETKMREIRKTKQKEEREEEATKRALASIEAKAAQAYQADPAGGVDLRTHMDPNR